MIQDELRIDIAPLVPQGIVQMKFDKSVEWVGLREPKNG